MIDLHMHTTESDGELTVAEIRQRIDTLQIERYAITDHNHALAYEKFDYKKDKKLIPGTEITSSYQGVIVEVLLYHIDPSVINTWYKNYYTKEKLIEIETLLFNDLKRIMIKEGYHFDENYQLEKIEKGFAKKQIYYDIIETNPNFSYKTYKQFFREALSNPKSNFFLDEARTYPTLEEVMTLSKNAGGIAILAHPYEYGLPIKQLEKLVIDYKLDGMEAFHPSASTRQSLAILNFCDENGLKSSMGSDFHKDERKVPLGVHIHDDVWNYKALRWINPKE